jgi:hypothetical protein
VPIFFQGVPGRTVALLDPAVQGSVSLATVNPDVSWATTRSIITRVTVSHQGNFQFLHTLGNDVYIYSFGDRVGSLTISGLAMANACGGGLDQQHGAELILGWYNANRLSSRQAPVRVTLGQKTAIDGFVIGSNVDVIDPATRVVAYSLSLAVLPDKV